MNIELRCKKCGYTKTVLPVELDKDPCAICGGAFVLANPKKTISEAIDMDLDKQMQIDINKLGLERFIEEVKKYPHLRKCYGPRLNKRFGRKIIDEQ